MDEEPDLRSSCWDFMAVLRVCIGGHHIGVATHELLPVHRLLPCQRVHLDPLVISPPSELAEGGQLLAVRVACLLLQGDSRSLVEFWGFSLLLLSGDDTDIN